jgi:hypothetical protein
MFVSWIKQALRAWYSRFSTKLRALGFKASKADTSMFIYDRQGVTLFLLVYVVDIIITNSCTTAIDELLKDLNSEFALKDLGDLHYFLGIHVKKEGHSIVLSQEKYAADLLERAKMHHCKAVATPLSTTEKLSIEGRTRSSEVDSMRYRSIVGAL